MRTIVGGICFVPLIYCLPALGQTCPPEYGVIPPDPDDTICLQQLIDDPNAPLNAADQRQVTIPNIGRPWKTGPILLPGDLELTFGAGVVIEADDHVFTAMYGEPSQGPCGPVGPYGIDDYVPVFQVDRWRFNKLFMATGVDNLTIVGNGATLRMQQETDPYPACSNFLHALALINVTNVEVSGLNVEDTGGDGIYIRCTQSAPNGHNVYVHDCTVDDANRNGMSVASGSNITVENCVLKNSARKNPRSGVDVEPGNPANNFLKNVLIKGCTAEFNISAGFVFNASALNRGSPPVENVRFEDCTAIYTGHQSATGLGFFVREFLTCEETPNLADPDAGFVRGSVEFVNCRAEDVPPQDGPNSHGLRLDWDTRSPLEVSFTGCRWIDGHDDGRSLIRAVLYGKSSSPGPARITIEGTVLGMDDPLFDVALCTSSTGTQCNNYDPPRPDRCQCVALPGSCVATSYPEFAGCLGARNAQIDPNHDVLLPNLETSTCGDGILDTCEECDDGNTEDLDDCSNLCVVPPTTPRIRLKWDLGGSTEQPFEGQDYEITGTEDSPNVALLRGRADWRIWSEDEINATRVSDIGSISISPEAPGNFTVKLLRPDDSPGPGARNVKALSLVPAGNENHSSIAAGEITGRVEEAVAVKAVAGSGGELNLSIGGDSTADIDARVVTGLSIAGDSTGAIDIEELAAGSELAIAGDVSGNIDIDRAKGEVRLGYLGGQITGSVNIDELNPDAVPDHRLEIGSDLAASGSITIGTIGAGTQIEMGSYPAPFRLIDGTFTFTEGVGENIAVHLLGQLGSTGSIDLNNAGVQGSLLVHAGGSGSIVNGGVVSGEVYLGNCCDVIAGPGPFTGSATFAGTSGEQALIAVDGFGYPDSTGSLHLTGAHAGGEIRADDMSAGDSITITGDSIGDIILGWVSEIGAIADGSITIGGELSGALTILGTFGGTLCASNLDGTKPLPANVEINNVSSTAQVCDVDENGACTACVTAGSCSPPAAAPSEEPGGLNKNRFISFVPGTSAGTTAIAVVLDSLHHPAEPPNHPDFSDAEGQLRYVNAFRDLNGNQVFTCPDTAPAPDFKCAKLGCVPEYHDWQSVLGSASAVLHVTGSEITPSSRYNVHSGLNECASNWAGFSPGLVADTARWGDLNGDNALNVVDVGLVTNKLRTPPDAPAEYQLLLHHQLPDPYFLWVNIISIGFATDALKGLPYPFNVDNCP